MSHERRIMLLEQAFNSGHQGRFFDAAESMRRGMVWNSDIHIDVQYLILRQRSGPLIFGTKRFLCSNYTRVIRQCAYEAIVSYPTA